MSELFETYQRKIADKALAPDPDQFLAVEKLSVLAERLEAGEKNRIGIFKKASAPYKGFYFYGGVGRGKTMAMDLFFQNLRVKKKRRVHFHAFMLEVHDFLHQLRSKRKKKTEIDDDLMAFADDAAARATVLCFDEFQVKDVADAMILGRLFTALFDRGVTVLMTSNIAPDDLYADGLQRDRFLPFIDLLKEKLEIFSFGGAQDYRMQKLAGTKMYFWPNDADAEETLDRIFHDMADGDAGRGVDLAVKGRIIHVPRSARHVAFFDFKSLCGEARSAVDYLELARHFRVFIVRDVPRLDDSRRNEALRFVTFIDTAYDAGARVVLSAAVPAADIYKGEELSAVFSRTVSRITEMQARDYGRKG